MNKILKEEWDFVCDCCMCEDDRATLSTAKAQRAKLIKSFDAPNASSKRKMDIIAELNRTYQHPPTKSLDLRCGIFISASLKDLPRKESRKR